MSNGFEQHYACGDRYVQAANVPAHRNGRQPIAALPHQTPQAGSFGSENQRSWQRQVDGVIGVGSFGRESDGPDARLFQFLHGARDVDDLGNLHVGNGARRCFGGDAAGNGVQREEQDHELDSVGQAQGDDVARRNAQVG